MKTPRNKIDPLKRNRKSIRNLIEPPAHRRLRHGPHAGTHCTCGCALVPVCSELLYTMGMQMHLPAKPAVGERQRSQAEQANYAERQATKQRRLELLRRISAQLDPDPVEVARRTHAQIRAEEEGIVV